MKRNEIGWLDKSLNIEKQGLTKCCFCICCATHVTELFLLYKYRWFLVLTSGHRRRQPDHPPLQKGGVPARCRPQHQDPERIWKMIPMLLSNFCFGGGAQSVLKWTGQDSERNFMFLFLVRNLLSFTAHNHCFNISWQGGFALKDLETILLIFQVVQNRRSRYILPPYDPGSEQTPETANSATIYTTHVEIKQSVCTKDAQLIRKKFQNLSQVRTGDIYHANFYSTRSIFSNFCCRLLAWWPLPLSLGSLWAKLAGSLFVHCNLLHLLPQFLSSSCLNYCGPYIWSYNCENIDLCTALLLISGEGSEEKALQGSHVWGMPVKVLSPFFFVNIWDTCGCYQRKLEWWGGKFFIRGCSYIS